MKYYKSMQYFIDENPLDEGQKKYCRCILHVAKQQPDWCLKEKAWYKIKNNKKCYNPYAVCTSSVGRGSGSSSNSGSSFECSPYYDFTRIPSEEVRAFELLKGKDVHSAYDKQLPRGASKASKASRPSGDDRLQKACQGKSESKGGLNKDSLRQLYVLRGLSGQGAAPLSMSRSQLIDALCSP